MAKRIRKRKCRNCHELFYPDHRNLKKQRYCSKADCRAASKKASNDKWRQKEENRDYFSGPSQVERVQEWRKLNPGYSTTTPKSKKTLQDDLNAESPANKGESSDLSDLALQDDLILQSPVIVGLIAHLTENTLQDDIVKSLTVMRQLGLDILNNVVENNECLIHHNGGSHDNKNPHRSPTHSQDPG